MTRRILFRYAALVVVAVSAFTLGWYARPAPHECTVALNAASKAFVTYDNLVYSTFLRSNRGQAEFAKHDADIAAGWDELDDLAVIYNPAEAECLDGAR